MTRELLIRSICTRFLNNVAGLQDLVDAKLDEVLSLDGRSITSVSESGRSTSFHIPVNMNPEEVHALLARALQILTAHSTSAIQNWLKYPPTNEVRPRYGRYWFGV
jgi:hypothetical protein